MPRRLSAMPSMGRLMTKSAYGHPGHFTLLCMLILYFWFKYTDQRGWRCHHNTGAFVWQLDSRRFGHLSFETPRWQLNSRLFCHRDSACSNSGYLSWGCRTCRLWSTGIPVHVCFSSDWFHFVHLVHRYLNFLLMMVRWNRPSIFLYKLLNVTSVLMPPIVTWFILCMSLSIHFV